MSWRPREELYHVAEDPDQLDNLAADPEWTEQKEQLERMLFAELEATGDPRATGGGSAFEGYPYYGRSRRKD